jgi:hypothetical protein
MFYLLKHKLIAIINKKNVILSAVSVHSVQRCMHSLYSSSWRNPVKYSCAKEAVHGGDAVDLFGTAEMGNASVKSLRHVKQEQGARWLHLWEKTSCSSIAKDKWRTGANRFELDVICVVLTVAPTLCLLNPIETYWIAASNNYFNTCCLTHSA